MVWDPGSWCRMANKSAGSRNCSAESMSFPFLSSSLQRSAKKQDPATYSFPKLIRQFFYLTILWIPHAFIASLIEEKIFISSSSQNHLCKDFLKLIFCLLILIPHWYCSIRLIKCRFISLRMINVLVEERLRPKASCRFSVRVSSRWKSVMWSSFVLWLKFWTCFLPYVMFDDFPTPLRCCSIFCR